MINISNLNIGGGAGQAAAGSLPVKLPEAVPATPVVQPVVVQPTVSEVVLQSERMLAMKQAIAASLPKFFYPVSDVKFTMYKVGEQMVTRVTSLITGAVTEIPEQSFLPDIATGGNTSTIA